MEGRQALKGRNSGMWSEQAADQIRLQTRAGGSSKQAADKKRQTRAGGRSKQAAN
jgi:hypothetical protein